MGQSHQFRDVRVTSAFPDSDGVADIATLRICAQTQTSRRSFDYLVGKGRLARAGRAHSGIPAFRSASTIRARRSADANAKDVKFALDMLARGLI